MASATSKGPEVRLLGPVQLVAGGDQYDLGPAKQRCVLAALAWEAGSVVATDVLVDRVWGSDPSGNVVGVLRTYVARLRRALAAVPGADDRLLRRERSGYVLGLDRDQVDALRFRDLISRARRSEDGPDLGRIREALALWRGLPLTGLSGDWVDGVRSGLDALRQGAVCDRIEGDLRAGAYAGLVDELTGLTAEYPMNESMATLLMRALYAEGRRAEALEAFQRLRQRLVDELGVGPGEEADSLHQLILRGERVEATAQPARSGPPFPVPRQLPTGPAAFVGREAELDTVLRRLDAGAADGDSATVVAIHGTGGVGKSALALRAAHAVADRYPDGQLYVDLQGSTPGMQPLTATDALGRLLRATAGTASVPEDVDEAAALLRSSLAGRRILIVLDNAASTEQVRPLLPGPGECAVIVTGRGVMPGLDSATQVTLDRFGPDEAVAMLGELDPVGRLDDDPQAAAELADLCAYLPLALRVLASRIASRPGWPIGEFVRRLRGERRRLDQLGHADVSVRGCFEVSRRVLAASDDPVDTVAARCFPLLGLPTGPDISLPVATRLLGLNDDAAEAALERLADLHLVESPLPGRYRMHDLLRLYAREIAEEKLSETERFAALYRSWEVYAETAERATALLNPGVFHERGIGEQAALPISSVDQATRWIQEERGNLVAAVEQAVQAPERQAAMTFRLAQALYPVLAEADAQGLRHIAQLALDVARRLQDEAAEARALSDLSVALFTLGQVDDALRHQREALAVRRTQGRASEVARSLHNLGIMLAGTGDHEGALEHLGEALGILRQLDEPVMEANGLGVLAEVNLALGYEERAHEQLQESLAIYRDHGDPYGMAEQLQRLGELLLAQGKISEAVTTFDEVVTLNRELRRDGAVAHSLAFSGEAHRRLGEWDKAIACLGEAAVLAQNVRDVGEEARSLRWLGDTWAAAGDLERAHGYWRQALPLLERLRHPEAGELRSRLRGDGSGSGR